MFSDLHVWFFSICLFFSVIPFLWMVISVTNKSIDIIAGKFFLEPILLEISNNFLLLCLSAALF